MSRLRFALLYWLAWVPFAVLYATIIGSQQGVRLGDALWGGAGTAGVAALLGLGVWWSTARLNRRPVRGVALLAAHVLLAVAYAALWTLSLVAMMVSEAPPEAAERFLDVAVWWQALMGLSLYGVIAGVAHAVRSAQHAREQQARVERAESLRAVAELRALRAQLNPHMVFNTLHSITALVRSDPQAVEHALERFASLLRYVLDVNRRRSDEVTVEDELAFVRTYLALEQLRLGDRLRVVEEVDPEAVECAMLAFTLQPLVENAIRHGIAPRPGGGTIRIAAKFAGDRLELEIGDDGAGAEPATVALGQGLGLQVVRQRLAARYGDAATLDIVTARQNGFLVRIALPIATLRVAQPHPVPA